MPDVSDFRPNWISPPGDTINDLLRERGISLAESMNVYPLEFDLTELSIQDKDRIPPVTK